MKEQDLTTAAHHVRLDQRRWEAEGTGMIVCTECGSENPVGMLFCSACGATLTGTNPKGQEALKAADGETERVEDGLTDLEKMTHTDTNIGVDEGSLDEDTVEKAEEQMTEESGPMKEIEDSDATNIADRESPLAGLPEPYDRGVRSPLSALADGETLSENRWWLEPTIETPKPEPKVEEATPVRREAAMAGAGDAELPDLRTDPFDGYEEETSSSGGLIIIAVIVAVALGAFALL